LQVFLLWLLLVVWRQSFSYFELFALTLLSALQLADLVLQLVDGDLDALVG
jgi:hypothetical protein